MTRCSITLKGPAIKPAHISASLLRELLDLLTEGVRRAVRLRVEGRSTARGSLPHWLAAACAFDVVGLSKGSTVLEIEALPLAEAAPERFAQRRIFVDVSRPGLSYLADSLEDALAGRADSDGFDLPLLTHLDRFSRLFGPGVELVELALRPHAGRAPLRLGPEGLATIHRLRRQTPRPRKVRIAGKLDLIRHSDRMFTLQLESGKTLRGVAGDIPIDRLRNLFGKSVVVSALAVFRPSGSLLRLEADHLQEATGDISIWSTEPSPLEADLEPRSLRKPQGPRTGVNAIFGQWPGDETEEEILAALEDLS